MFPRPLSLGPLLLHLLLQPTTMWTCMCSAENVVQRIGKRIGTGPFEQNILIFNILWDFLLLFRNRDFMFFWAALVGRRDAINRSVI